MVQHYLSREGYEIIAAGYPDALGNSCFTLMRVFRPVNLSISEAVSQKSGKMLAHCVRSLHHAPAIVLVVLPGL